MKNRGLKNKKHWQVVSSREKDIHGMKSLIFFLLGISKEGNVEEEVKIIFMEY